MATNLAQMLEVTRAGLSDLRSRANELERAAAAAPAAPAFDSGFIGERIGLVAEVKRRSPSAGVIRAELDPAEQAACYVRHGAVAVSVLTDGPHFGGSIADLEAVVRRIDRPVLRKDFILDETQILEARAAGASAVLLIVRALVPSRLRELLDFTRATGLEALVELHTSDELGVALDAGARILGVNSRDLDTFRIDVEAAWNLIEAVPHTCVAIAESGMTTIQDVERAAAAGADGVLVGTALSAATNPGPQVRAFAEVRRRGR